MQIKHPCSLCLHHPHAQFPYHRQDKYKAVLDQCRVQMVWDESRSASTAHFDNPLLLIPVYPQSLLDAFKALDSQTRWKIMGNNKFNKHHSPGCSPGVLLVYSCALALHSCES